jgi:hypothetical protein
MFTSWVFPEVWTVWVGSLAATLHQRSAWRLTVLITGVILAQGRRTVTSWFRAAGIAEPYKAFYYFIGSLGRRTEIIATVLFELMIQMACRDGDRVLVAIDDTPTKRYGPKVEGAGIHHNPTPGPEKAKFVYGHLWVTLSVVVRHGVWGTIGLPLLAKMYIRVKDLAKVPKEYRVGFQTKLQQGAKMVEWAAARCQQAGKILWVVVDGGYTKAPFLKPATAAGATIIARLRSDAALQTVPKAIKKRKRGQGRPRKYGRNRIHLHQKASQRSGWSTITVTLYGEQVSKSVKLFKATYPPAGGQIVVLIVREDNGSWRAYLCTNLSATAEQILEAVADRAAIEQNFHDLKEIEGIGQQQLRNFWANIGALHLNMWVHTLIELWAWNKPASVLCDRRACPWDDPARRPSHADRRAALRQEVIKETFFETFGHDRKSRKILRHFDKLLKLAI